MIKSKYRDNPDEKANLFEAYHSCWLRLWKATRALSLWDCLEKRASSEDREMSFIDTARNAAFEMGVVHFAGLLDKRKDSVGIRRLIREARLENDPSVKTLTKNLALNFLKEIELLEADYKDLLDFRHNMIAHSHERATIQDHWDWEDKVACKYESAIIKTNNLFNAICDAIGLQSFQAPDYNKAFSEQIKRLNA
ncbi:MAG: hypothetical protein NTV93_21130 [Verrucomicrobia bacterium]|nr:hypothetical protein [Verrucomicrobiota bacterium]